MRCQGFLRASIFHSTVNMNTVGRGHLLVRGGHSTYSFAHYELVTRENQSDNTRVLLYYLPIGLSAVRSNSNYHKALVRCGS
jgi:hypothetical protein